MADALRRSRPGIWVPYLSGYPEDTAVGHGVLDAGVDFLPKPFSRDVLGLKGARVPEEPGARPRARVHTGEKLRCKCGTLV